MKLFRLILILFVFIYKNGYTQNRPQSQLTLISSEVGENKRPSSIRDSVMSKFSAKSTKLNKNPDAKIEDYLIITHDHDTIVVDTSLTIQKYYKLNFLRRDDFDLIPFSNTGSAYNVLGFRSKETQFSEIGAKNKSIAYDNVDDVLYYDLPTPFTELMYRSVFEQGQVLDAVYSVNTSRQFNFTISRKGLRSLGNYQNFITSGSNFKLASNYWSKNKKYYLRLHYANQKLFGEQNGGIADSDIDNFENGVSQYIDRGVFDPNFENAHNELLGKRFYLDQVYKFHENDSINKDKFEIYNSILQEEKQYKFQQSSIDDFFGEGYSNQEINDKIFLNRFKVDLGLNFKSDRMGGISAGLSLIDDKYSLQNFEIEDFVDNNQSIKSTTIYFLADYSKKIKQAKFSFSSNNYIFGDSKSNSVKTNIRFDIKNQNSVNLELSVLNSTPDYNHRLYSSNYINYNWNNEFQNIKSKAISLNVRLNKFINLDIDYINIENHIQFEQLETTSINDFGSSIRPIQYNGIIDLLKIKLNRSISIGKFSFDSSLLFQKSISNDIINVPKIITRNTIYFSSDLFKKALFLQTGFGVKYFSKYYMNGYDPLLSELYIQREKEIGDFPLIDFFINAKIQQTRLYFKFEHLNSSLTGYNFYSAPNYPFRDFTFRFGLVWNFFM